MMLHIQVTYLFTEIDVSIGAEGAGGGDDGVSNCDLN